MNVEWDKRALQQHRQRGHIKRVQARLTDTHISDIVLGVPVLTDRQIMDLTRLRDQFREVAAVLDAQLDVLDTALNLLRPFGHSDGWADVRIVGHEKGNIIVADVRHRTGANQKRARESTRVMAHWPRKAHTDGARRRR